MPEVDTDDSAERLRGFEGYPTYKDSGVEWLGNIPAHWEARRLRHVVSWIEQGWSPDCENREADEAEWGVLKAGCVNRGLFVEAEHKALPVAVTPIPSLEVRRGDLLMSRASGSRDLVGSVAVVPTCRPRLLLCDKVLRLHVAPHAANKPFLAYAMNSCVARWQIELALSGGSGLANNIAQSVVKDMLIALPPPNEQTAIADSLDRESKRIDALVAKKERLIELLQERRAALITRAVTKGLDSTVPMKNSGVEWLAEIPAHWEVRPNGLVFTERDQRGRQDMPILEVSIAHGVRVREFSQRKIEQRSDDLGAYKIAREGDIAFNKMRMWQGAVGVAPQDGLVSPDYIVARPLASSDPRYYAALFRTPPYMAEVYRWSHGIVDDRNRLYWDDFKAIRSPFPPPHEQRRIMSALERETATIDALVNKVRDALKHLGEFRTALVSAAVTGKIDVRDTPPIRPGSS